MSSFSLLFSLPVPVPPLSSSSSSLLLLLLLSSSSPPPLLLLLLLLSPPPPPPPPPAPCCPPSIRTMAARGPRRRPAPPRLRASTARCAAPLPRSAGAAWAPNPTYYHAVYDVRVEQYREVPFISGVHSRLSSMPLASQHGDPAAPPNRRRGGVVDHRDVILAHQAHKKLNTPQARRKQWESEICHSLEQTDRQRNRQAEEQTGRGTDRQRNRQAERQTGRGNRQAEEQTDRGTDRQTCRGTDRQTNRQAEEQTGRGTDRQGTDRQRNRQAEEQTGSGTDRQRNRQAEGQTGRGTDRQTGETDRQRNRHAEEQTGRGTDRQWDRQAEGQTGRGTDRQTCRGTDRQRNRHADRQAEEQTDRRADRQLLSQCRSDQVCPRGLGVITPNELPQDQGLQQLLCPLSSLIVIESMCPASAASPASAPPPSVAGAVKPDPAQLKLHLLSLGAARSLDTGVPGPDFAEGHKERTVAAIQCPHAKATFIPHQNLSLPHQRHIPQTTEEEALLDAALFGVGLRPDAVTQGHPPLCDWPAASRLVRATPYP
ncbi:unnamed protein product [Pleuronectes platessa]|uniref:Uncharacterized protein n=1 Tax=Pleuronectes platessa TaxID=8262 RepID=A0A9N7U7C2_PLEPL|nr:unnamed protein product [Pleuronectes platessa]